MASLTYHSGRALIQWLDAAGKRKTLRLSGVNRDGAEELRRHVAHLLSAQRLQSSPPRKTVEWMAALGDAVYARLVKAGLATPRGQTDRPAAQLETFVTRYIKGRTDLKERSVSNLRQVRKHLVAHFGQRQDITAITRGDMGDWHRSLKAKLAGATVSLHVKRARQIFQDAVDRKLIAENPVKGIKAGKQTNPDRVVYVPEASIAAVIDACPDHEWKLIWALARYAGVRVPSETNPLRWADVRWDKARMIVHAPKTEGYEGKAQRTVPIFPELLPYLLDAFEKAEPGAEHVIARHRGENLRRMGEKIINRAGLVMWPKVFQNLRASRETDLADVYPIHVVCAWIGNTEAVARKHYLQVKESHFAAAAGRAAPGAAATGGKGRKASTPQTQNPPISEGFAQTSYPQGGHGKGGNFGEFLVNHADALHRALHRLRSALPRIRQRDIRRIGLALRNARRADAARSRRPASLPPTPRLPAATPPASPFPSPEGQDA